MPNGQRYAPPQKRAVHGRYSISATYVARKQRAVEQLVEFQDCQRNAKKVDGGGMVRRGEQRTCRRCGRKNALDRHDLFEVIVCRCRWCGHETSYATHRI